MRGELVEFYGENVGFIKLFFLNSGDFVEFYGENFEFKKLVFKRVVNLLKF